jgi:hypothetical protein
VLVVAYSGREPAAAGLSATRSSRADPAQTDPQAGRCRKLQGRVESKEKHELSRKSKNQAYSATKFKNTVKMIELQTVESAA